MLQPIHRYIGHCVLCGSFWPPIEYVCAGCRKHIASRQSKSQFVPAPLPFLVTALWEWWPGDRVLGRLLHNLKGEPTALGKAYVSSQAKDLATRRLSHQRFLSHHILVPSPPRVEGEADHATTLAQELGRHLKIPCHQILKRREENLRQKKKRRVERSTRVLDLKVKRAQRETEGRGYIFVDDVLTTGSTAKAAWKALGRPSNYQVWVLAYRSSLL